MIGLEPTCLAAPDPKSGASANFATLASSESCVMRSVKYIFLIPRNIDPGLTPPAEEGKACKTRLFFVNS